MTSRHAYCRVYDTKRCACPLGSAFEQSEVLDASNLRWVSLAQLVSSMGIACIDGRHRECALGSPGGDAGELLLLLATVEQIRRVELGEAAIRAALVDYATAQGRFSFHTDDSTLQALLHHVDSLVVTEDAARLELGAHWRFEHASSLEREALRPLVTRPEYLGCGHLRNMLVAPKTYGVRPELVDTVISLTIEELWEGSLPIQFSVLDGAHLERAVVSFQSRATFNRESAIPTPCGTAERGLFVHHGAVLDYLRSQTLDVLARNSLGQLNLTEVLDDIQDEVRRLACVHLAATLDQLAPGIERYCVRFDAQHRKLLKSYRVSPAASKATS